MNTLTSNLIEAHETLDTDTVANIGKKLCESEKDRGEVAIDLIEIIGRQNFKQAEVAISLLLITGMAQDPGNSKKLALISQGIFTPKFFHDTEKKLNLLKESAQIRLPLEIRFAKSMIHALAKNNNANAVNAIQSIKKQIAGTSLEPYII